MLRRIARLNDRLNRNLDAVALVPLGFVALLGLVVLATVVFENPAAAVAASHIGRFEG